MQFTIPQRQRSDPAEWHWRFAWRPRRISPDCIVWLEFYQRRLHVVDEGCWGGGYKWQWHYSTPDAGVWAGPVHGY